MFAGLIECISAHWSRICRRRKVSEGYKHGLDEDDIIKTILSKILITNVLGNYLGMGPINQPTIIPGSSCNRT